MGHKYVKEEDTFSTSANGTVPKPTAQEASDGKVLGADGTWVLPGGSQSLSGLTDTEITTPSSGQVLKYDGSKWVNANESGGSTHTYSTTEQVVGTWIDGKPVYERVYELPSTLSLASNTWTNVTSASNANMKAILKATGITTYGTLFDFFGAARDSGSYVRLLSTRPSGVDINVLILQYTKTTD